MHSLTRIQYMTCNAINPSRTEDHPGGLKNQCYGMESIFCQCSPCFDHRFPPVFEKLEKDHPGGPGGLFHGPVWINKIPR